MRYSIHFYRGSRLRCIIDVPGEVLTGRQFCRWAQPIIEEQAQIGRDDWAVVPEDGRRWEGFIGMSVKDREEEGTKLQIPPCSMCIPYGRPGWIVNAHQWMHCPQCNTQYV